MPNLIDLAAISAVKTGALGTVVISGQTADQQPVEIAMPITEIQNLAPKLLEAATVMTHYQWPPPGTALAGAWIAVADAEAGAANTTNEPFLKVHTVGGTLLLLFPSSAAIACGRDLERYGHAAATPPAGAQH
jgi:hypothetical protein